MHRRVPERGSRRDAVTFVELLAVVAVLTLLFALAVPVLRRAFDYSGIAQSAANLRALALMAHAFAADNSGLLPQMQTAAGTWDTLLRGYSPQTSDRVFAARADHFTRPPGKTARSYSLNPALAGRRFAILDETCRLALFVERHASLYGEPMAYVGGLPYRPTGYSDFPYEGKTQIARTDGSVTLVGRMDWTAWHERYIFP